MWIEEDGQLEGWYSCIGGGEKGLHIWTMFPYDVDMLLFTCKILFYFEECEL